MGCGGSKSASVVNEKKESEETITTNDNSKEPVQSDKTEISTTKDDSKSKKTDNEKVVKEADRTFKIVIVGDERSGKTCISTRFVRDEFIDMYLPTLGAESKSKVVNVGGKAVKFQILDTSGNERFRQQTTSSICDADGVIMVFDLANRASLNNIGFWHKLVISQAPGHCVVALAGNKSDDPNREVSEEDARAVAEICGTDLVETSAKNSVNLETLFSKIGAKLVN